MMHELEAMAVAWKDLCRARNAWSKARKALEYRDFQLHDLSCACRARNFGGLKRSTLLADVKRTEKVKLAAQRAYADAKARYNSALE